MLQFLKWLFGYTLSTSEWADVVANHPKLYKVYCLGILSEREIVKVYRKGPQDGGPAW